MPVMQVLRSDLPWKFSLTVPATSSVEEDEQSLAGFMEDLEALCLEEAVDCWQEAPAEKQRKLRVEQ